MKRVLEILGEELHRLKADGVSSLPVSEAGLAALRRTIVSRAAQEAKPSPGVPDTRGQADSFHATAKKPPPRRNPGKSVTETEPSVPIPPPPEVKLPEGDKRGRWDSLRSLVLNDPVCLAHVRPGKKVVLGVGDLDAKILFVGEAPGADEEVQGEPFVGPAGQLLTRMIGAMGLGREEVYIGNIMNWRPEMPTAAGSEQYGNRPPTGEEMAYCIPYLRAQIAIVEPEVIVALGATAAHGLLGAGAFKALGEVRGSWREFEGRPLMITYHPSYILRNSTNRSKRMIWEDLLKVMERVALPVSERQRGYFLGK
jgi:uracil-DNA glycosylase family 4